MARTHSHYFKPCPFVEVDVYRVLLMFGVTDPCLQHAIKKLLVAGGRGNKDLTKDVSEAVVSCQRFLEMREEEVFFDRQALTPRPTASPITTLKDALTLLGMYGRVRASCFPTLIADELVTRHLVEITAPETLESASQYLVLTRAGYEAAAKDDV